MNEPFVPARWREAYEWKQADGDKEEEKVKKTNKIPRFSPLIYRSKTHQFIAPLCDELCYAPESHQDQVLTWDKIFTTLSDKLCHCYRIPPYTQKLEPGCISVFHICDRFNNVTQCSQWENSILHDTTHMYDYNLVMFHDPNFAEFVNDGLEARMATIARHITTIIEGYRFAGAKDDIDHKITTTAASLHEKQKIRSQIKPQDFDHLMYGTNVKRLDYFPKDRQRTMANENLSFYNQFI